MNIPNNNYTKLFEIKKSKFIVNIAHACDEKSAFSFLEEKKDLQANHNCWAFKIENVLRFSDDGEPSGTAGKPILNAIVNNNFDQTIVIVTRYFGGIKLGAGGLIRAYSGVVSDALKETPFELLKKYIESEIIIPFELTGEIFSILAKYKLKPTAEEYTNTGRKLKLKYEEKLNSTINNEIIEITGGKISLKII